MSDLDKRLDQIQDKLKSPEFLTNKQLGGEIGFYIFDYPAQQEQKVRDKVTWLNNQLNKDNTPFASINLFAKIIELLESRKLLDRVFKMQLEKGDEAVFKALKGPLEQNRLADFMLKDIDLTQCKFILLHGLGSVWPIVRGHGLLNALHAKVGHVPTVMFYPGTYANGELKPFNEIASDNYYRAFNLIPK